MILALCDGGKVLRKANFCETPGRCDTLCGGSGGGAPQALPNTPISAFPSDGRCDLSFLHLPRPWTRVHKRALKTH